MLCEHHCEHSDGIGILLEDVQLAITGDARIRTSFGDGVGHGVMAWSVTNGPETHQRMKDCLEAVMGFPVSEAYSLPMNAKSLVGSVMANLCGSHCPLHMAMVGASSQRKTIDKAFSIPKCVRLARMSHHSH